MLSNITKRLLPSGGFNRASCTNVAAASLFAVNQTRCYASRRPQRPQQQRPRRKTEEPLSLNNIPEDQGTYETTNRSPRKLL